MNDIIMSARDLRAHYITEMFGVSREVSVIDGISMDVHRNEIYGIAGESGCGKTTLLKLIAGSYQASLKVLNGSVTYFFDEKNPLNILKASKQDIDNIRWRNLSYIMQGSMNVLNPLRKIYKSFVDFAWKHMDFPDEKLFRKAVEQHLAKLWLSPEVLVSYPHELSGGMRQRVTIALATICEPRIIIADEPTTALDVVVQRETLNLLKQIQTSQNNTVLLVTHDMAVHANIADRIGIMYAGRLVEEASTRDIFYSPRHPYTQHLVKSLPRIGDKSQKESLQGAPPNLAEPPEGCRFHPRCPYARDICTGEVPEMKSSSPDHRVACFFEQTEGNNQ